MKLKPALIIGSAPDAIRARDFDAGRFSSITAINNAWQIRDDCNFLIFPDDFPVNRQPPIRYKAKIVRSDNYVPANNTFGGIVYAGATMAFTAGYWALRTLKPDILGFIGCDMVYGKGETHFYGTGTPDAIRKDPTLQNLEAKSARMMLLAARHGTLCVNYSQKEESRLTFPRVTVDVSESDLAALFQENLSRFKLTATTEAINKALEQEEKIGAYVPDGDYWATGRSLDAEALSHIDDLWLMALAEAH